jgi:uncharacterized protein
MTKLSVKGAKPHRWPTVDALRIESARLGRDLRVSIARPCDNTGGGKPVLLYLLDPSFNFSAAVTTAAFLGDFARMAGGHWPNLVVAGIGYDTEDPREVMTRRALDLTPTAHGAPAGVQLPPLAFGGAASFLAALHDEVMPTVEGRLGTAPSARILAGHSFGGLFGLYTLFHKPQMFDGYLLVSPSVWWDDRVVFRYEQASREANQPLDVRLFLAVGEKEQAAGGGWRNEGFPDDALEKLRQVRNFRDLVGRLEHRSRHGLRLESAVLPNEYHLTVFPAAFGAGLRWLIESPG